MTAVEQGQRFSVRRRLSALWRTRLNPEPAAPDRAAAASPPIGGDMAHTYRSDQHEPGQTTTALGRTHVDTFAPVDIDQLTEAITRARNELGQGPAIVLTAEPVIYDRLAAAWGIDAQAHPEPADTDCEDHSGDVIAWATTPAAEEGEDRD